MAVVWTGQFKTIVSIVYFHPTRTGLGGSSEEEGGYGTVNFTLTSSFIAILSLGTFFGICMFQNSSVQTFQP